MKSMSVNKCLDIWISNALYYWENKLFVELSQVNGEMRSLVSWHWAFNVKFLSVYLGSCIPITFPIWLTDKQKMKRLTCFEPSTGGYSYCYKGIWSGIHMIQAAFIYLKSGNNCFRWLVYAADYDTLRALDSENISTTLSMSEEEINALPVHKYKASGVQRWVQMPFLL